MLKTIIFLGSLISLFSVDGKCEKSNILSEDFQEPQKVMKGWPADIEDIHYKSSVDGTFQPALFYAPKAKRPVPLLVALHTWSGDYRQEDPGYASWCIQNDWAMICPNFRGPNNKPQACGSDLAVQDILDAVIYSQETFLIDPNRIYLVGVSGGGHMALLMAGKTPEVWAGVSAWCGIYDLEQWYWETKATDKIYWKMLEKVCGEAPGISKSVDKEYQRRSPSAWLMNATDLALDINAGITDGHNGSVPVSHSLQAFNSLAKPCHKIAKNEIEILVAKPEVAVTLKTSESDPLYKSNPVVYRRISGNARITLFEGGHQILPTAAMEWLSRQTKGATANFEIKTICELNSEAVDSGR